MLLSKYCKIVYNSIFVIVDYCTKIVRYISITIRINIVKLVEIFFDKIVLYFKILANIIYNKEFVFTSIF